MSTETTVKYQELNNGKKKFSQVVTDLENAKIQRGKMVFNPIEVGGLTAEQAVCGFESIYGKLIDEISSLIANAESFLTEVGITFENLDNTVASDIQKEV
jgi:hypothetical protein